LVKENSQDVRSMEEIPTGKNKREHQGKYLTERKKTNT
jgi:hypothetical protein